MRNEWESSGWGARYVRTELSRNNAADSWLPGQRAGREVGSRVSLCVPRTSKGDTKAQVPTGLAGSGNTDSVSFEEPQLPQVLSYRASSSILSQLYKEPVPQIQIVKQPGYSPPDKAIFSCLGRETHSGLTSSEIESLPRPGMLLSPRVRFGPSVCLNPSTYLQGLSETPQCTAVWPAQPGTSPFPQKPVLSLSPGFTLWYCWQDCRDWLGQRCF